MRDQADELRSMVLRSVGTSARQSDNTPHMLAVVGGKGGVGTTSIAVNLSVALAQIGHRVVIVDGNLGSSDVAALCRLRERYGIMDVLSARRDIHEVLEAGPVGIQVLPGSWAAEDLHEETQYSRQRFLQRLHLLGPYADWIIIDAGSQMRPFATDLCQNAKQILLVTCPDTVSVMDAYATIKTLVRQTVVPSIRTIVNQTIDELASRAIHDRIGSSCERFLHLSIEMGGIIPLDEHVNSAAEIGVPFMTKSPTCLAARAVEKLAIHLVGELAITHETTHQRDAV